jgi:hypothetical protein
MQVGQEELQGSMHNNEISLKSSMRRFRQEKETWRRPGPLPEICVGSI